MKVKLSDLYDIGSSKRVFQSEWREEGIPFYRAREIAKLSVDGYVDNELFIDEELYSEYVQRYGKPEAGDIMVTGVGTLGVCYMVKPEDKFYFKDGNILWFKQKAHDRILPEYLIKAFNSKEVKEFIAKNSSGTTVGTFTIQTAKKLEISLPTIEEQKKIINKISSIERILKQRKNELELLDNLIKSRFVEMFGDPNVGFNYPTRKFKEYASDMTKGPFGSDMKKELYVPKGIDTYKVYIQMNAIQGNQDLGDYYISKEYFDKKISRFEVHPGDYIITCDGTLGKHLKLDDNMEKGVISSSLLRLTLDEGRMTKEYFEFIWDLYMLVLMKKEARNACLVHLPSAKVIGEVEIPIPPFELQKEFSMFAQQVNKLKFEVQKSLDETQTLMDSLMQQYFG